MKSLGTLGEGAGCQKTIWSGNTQQEPGLKDRPDPSRQEQQCETEVGRGAGAKASSSLSPLGSLGIYEGGGIFSGARRVLLA